MTAPVQNPPVPVPYAPVSGPPFDIYTIAFNCALAGMIASVKAETSLDPATYAYFTQVARAYAVAWDEAFNSAVALDEIQAGVCWTASQGFWANGNRVNVKPPTGAYDPALDTATYTTIIDAMLAGVTAEENSFANDGIAVPPWRGGGGGSLPTVPLNQVVLGTGAAGYKGSTPNTLSLVANLLAPVAVAGAGVPLTVASGGSTTTGPSGVAIFKSGDVAGVGTSGNAVLNSGASAGGNTGNVGVGSASTSGTGVPGTVIVNAGASANTDGSAVNVIGGAGGATAGNRGGPVGVFGGGAGGGSNGNGGNATVGGGNGNGTGTGGAMTLEGGTGGATGNGGSFLAVGGNGGATSGNGGSAGLVAGSANGSGNGGGATVGAGDGVGTGLGGDVILNGGAGGTAAGGPGGNITGTGGSAGAGSGQAGGAITFTAGTGDGAGHGGIAVLFGGAGGAGVGGAGGQAGVRGGDAGAGSDANGGNVSANGGSGNGAGAGGLTQMVGGAGGTGGNGGGVRAVGGVAVGTNLGGAALFSSGAGASGAFDGDVLLRAGNTNVLRVDGPTKIIGIQQPLLGDATTNDPQRFGTSVALDITAGGTFALTAAEYANQTVTLTGVAPAAPLVIQFPNVPGWTKVLDCRGANLAAVTSMRIELGANVVGFDVGVDAGGPDGLIVVAQAAGGIAVYRLTVAT